MSDVYFPGRLAQLLRDHGSMDANEGAAGNPDGKQNDRDDQEGKPEGIGHPNSQKDHQAHVDQQEKYEADQQQESHENSKEGKFSSHLDPNWTKRDTVAKDHMKHMMKKVNEEMAKRMDGHNHMTKHMMKKDVAKKKKKVPLLMGLGLPVLRKRFLNSFQVFIMISMMMTMTH